MTEIREQSQHSVILSQDCGLGERFHGPEFTDMSLVPKTWK